MTVDIVDLDDWIQLWLEICVPMKVDLFLMHDLIKKAIFLESGNFEYVTFAKMHRHGCSPNIIFCLY